MIFFDSMIVLILSIKSKINFLQLERYDNFKKHKYRQQFEKELDDVFDRLMITAVSFRWN